MLFFSRTTYDDNVITNTIEIYASPSGAIHFTESNNDCGIRNFDMEKFQLSKHFRFPWPVNVNQNKLVVVAGGVTALAARVYTTRNMKDNGCQRVGS
ncbi:hypothetical protein TSUD_322850 [Trifolium subterraneum]|uniref:Uncharacterized protein n=1 Tax=Trifolium subterraneum TaxID=3900 RepID=A0A2Z6N649_TRISU|nr:hypothetical protein TSUD_322850 [Trifolium subterraneum]